MTDTKQNPTEPLATGMLWRVVGLLSTLVIVFGGGYVAGFDDRLSKVEDRVIHNHENLMRHSSEAGHPVLSSEFKSFVSSMEKRLNRQDELIPKMIESDIRFTEALSNFSIVVSDLQQAISRLNNGG